MSPRVYEWVFCNILQRIDSERAHELALAALGIWGRTPGALKLTDRLLRPPPALVVKAFGLEFRSPLGVAAGVDKDATAFEALSALGFGSVEVGTATSRAQPGNPRVRAWRIPDQRALLNAMGFPNEGAEATGRLLARRRRGNVIGVNVGRSKVVVEESEVVDDYRAATRELARHADYIAINVSSPNTPGLREMQTVERLGALVAGVRAELDELGRPLPVFVKLGPDLPDAEIRALAEASSRIGVDAIVAVNTTTDYERLPACREAIREHGDRGGVSGRPLKTRAVAVLRILRESVDGIPLISVGGIEDAEDAWARILGGATLVQAYTGFVYGGPLWAHRLNRDLARLLEASPYTTLAEAVGKGSPEGAGGDGEPSDLPSRTESPSTPVA
jgi:dihydroorotate dehydrogenase